MAPIIVGLMRAVRPELGRITMFTAGSPEGWSVIVRSIEAAAREKSIGWEYIQVGSASHLERALDSLASAGKVQSFGRGRARRWVTPPLTGFTTTLLLPAPQLFD